MGRKGELGMRGFGVLAPLAPPPRRVPHIAFHSGRRRPRLRCSPTLSAHSHSDQGMDKEFTMKTEAQKRRERLSLLGNMSTKSHHGNRSTKKTGETIAAWKYLQSRMRYARTPVMASPRAKGRLMSMPACVRYFGLMDSITETE